MTYILNNCMRHGMHVRLLGLRARRLEFGKSVGPSVRPHSLQIALRSVATVARGVCEHDVPFFGLHIPFEANLLEKHFDEEALAAEDHGLAHSDPARSSLMTASDPSMTECCSVHGFARSPRWSSRSYYV